MSNENDNDNDSLSMRVNTFYQLEDCYELNWSCNFGYQVLALFPSSQGLEVTWSSVVKIGQSLYREGPGKDPFRPDQKTPVKNFFLAGSYTKQVNGCLILTIIILLIPVPRSSVRSLYYLTCFFVGEIIHLYLQLLIS